MYHIRRKHSTALEPKAYCGAKPELLPVGNPGSMELPVMMDWDWVKGHKLPICPKCKARIRKEKTANPAPF